MNRVAQEDNADRVVGAVNQAALRQEAVFEASRQELDPILRQLTCMDDRLNNIAEEVRGPDPFTQAGVVNQEEVGGRGATVDAIASGRFDPRMFAGTNLYGPGLGEASGYIPPTSPIPTSTPAYVNPPGFQPFQPEKIGGKPTVEMTNYFYDNPVPAETIVQETEREIARMNVRN